MAAINFPSSPTPNQVHTENGSSWIYVDGVWKSYNRTDLSFVNGTLDIANGGTGQATADEALNALLPAQTGNSGFVLSSDGTSTLWTAYEGTYSNATPVPSTLGGISSGTTFADKTMSEMWNMLLYPYQVPAFSSFTFGQSSPIEVGLTLSGSKTFTWGTTNSSNINTNSISISDVTNSSVLASSLANDGTESLNIGTVQKTTATSHTWRISATPSQGSTITRDYTISWQWRRYYGESTEPGPLTEAQIEGLRVSGLASGFAGTYSFSAGGYKYLAYPTAFGTASTFKDSSNNLDVPFEASYTVSVTNTNGINTTYRVHRSTNILGSAISIIVS